MGNPFVHVELNTPDPQKAKAFYSKLFVFALLSGYRLPQAGERLLIALALYEVRRFLNAGLRLRTACDFRTDGALQTQSPEGFQVPPEAELLTLVQQGIRECAASDLFASPAVTELTTACVVKADNFRMGPNSFPAEKLAQSGREVLELHPDAASIRWTPITYAMPSPCAPGTPGRAPTSPNLFRRRKSTDRSRGGSRHRSTAGMPWHAS